MEVPVVINILVVRLGVECQCLLHNKHIVMVEEAGVVLVAVLAHSLFVVRSEGVWFKPAPNLKGINFEARYN